MVVVGEVVVGEVVVATAVVDVDAGVVDVGGVVEDGGAVEAGSARVLVTTVRSAVLTGPAAGSPGAVTLKSGASRSVVAGGVESTCGALATDVPHPVVIKAIAATLPTRLRRCVKGSASTDSVRT